MSFADGVSSGRYFEAAAKLASLAALPGEQFPTTSLVSMRLECLPGLK
jgi:hypothetical protein